MSTKNQSSSTRSVFDALKAPPLSDLTRKRSVHCNPPPKYRGEGSSEPKSISASKQVEELPEECLEVTGVGKSKLFLAASERVFLFLTNPFGERQISSLQNYIEASIVMQSIRRIFHSNTNACSIAPYL